MNSNLLNELFVAALGSMVLGEQSARIRGTKEEVCVVGEALKTTRELTEELNSESATVKSVADKLSRRTTALRKFESLFGVKWPL